MTEKAPERTLLTYYASDKTRTAWYVPEARVEALTAERDALAAELRDVRMSELAALGQAQEAYEQQQALTAEVERLRVALSGYERKVSDYAHAEPAISDLAYDWLNEDGGNLARAALEEGKDG